MEFDTADGRGAFGAVTAATALAFFAMVGFEDSVNMAEETKDPVKIFPKVMLLGCASPASSTSWCRSPRSPW
jgi:amino acid transporter